MLTLRRLYLLMRSVSSLMGPMDGVLGREWVTLLYWTNDRWEEEELWFGGMIFANGNIWLEWLKGRQNSESYKQLLDEKALPRIRREMGIDFVLQQDNCSIHVSKLMKEWMAKVNMTTLEWPARSPDLNLIGNVWEMLAQLVYDGPEITKEAQLLERILGAKKQLIETRRDVIVYMFDHYEERLIKVIEKKGDITVFKRCPKNNVACVL